LTSLVKNIDRQLEEAASRSPVARPRGVYIIFCNDNPDQAKQLKDWIAAEKLKHVVVCKESGAGPDQYRVAREADVTAVVYERGRVKSNVALRKGGLNDDSAPTQIIEALSRVLPK
jgi:hypothetical protein